MNPTNSMIDEFEDYHIGLLQTFKYDGG